MDNLVERIDRMIEAHAARLGISVSDLVELLADAKDALLGLSPGASPPGDGENMPSAFIAPREATAKIEALTAERDQARAWRDAVDDALVTSWIGTADSFPDPRTALDKLIEWSMAVAVDPAVSKPASDLVDQARAKAIADVVNALKAHPDYGGYDFGPGLDAAIEIATAVGTGEWEK